MTKIAYLITSHTNPKQIARLSKTIISGSPKSNIVIHHDDSKSPLDSSLFEGLSDNIHILQDPINGKWGTYSLVEMTLYGLKWINDNLQYDWVVFISGQDYPTQSLHQLELFLQATEYDAFINGVSLKVKPSCDPMRPSAQSPNGLCYDCHTRYNYQYYEIKYSWQHNILKRLIKISRRIERRIGVTYPWILIREYPPLTQVKPKVGIKSINSPFNSNFNCYKGPQWFTINQASVKFILKKLQRTPAVNDYYKRTIIPDESIFQTILYNQSTLKICPDIKRYISWKSTHAINPDILRSSDFEQIIASGNHFARKFDINVDDKVLDMLDQHIDRNID